MRGFELYPTPIRMIKAEFAVVQKQTVHFEMIAKEPIMQAVPIATVTDDRMMDVLQVPSQLVTPSRFGL